MQKRDRGQEPGEIQACGQCGGKLSLYVFCLLPSISPSPLIPTPTPPHYRPSLPPHVPPPPLHPSWI